MKLLAYTEYKPSGIDWLGNIPSHWNSVKIKRKYKIVNGSTPSSADSINWGGDIIWITPADFSQANFGYIKTSQRQITEEGLLSCGTTLIPKKSIVISTRAPIGEVVQSAQELCTNQGCKSLVLDSDNAYERFHYYALLCNSEKLNSLGLGTTFMELSKNDLGNFYVPIPPMDEQIQIANILDHKTTQIDRLIEKKKALIEKLNEKRIALITQAVSKGLNPDAPMKPSGVDWLGDVPAHWSLIKLRFLTKENFANGVFKKSEHWGKGIPIINVTDLYVHNDLIDQDALERLECDEDEIKKYSALHGDFFLVRSSLKLDGIGKSATILEPIEDTVFECHVVRGRPDLDKVEPRFLNLYLNSKYSRDFFISRANVVTMATIDQEKLKSLYVMLPPLTEQQNIAKYLDISLRRIDLMFHTVRKAIVKIEEYRTALITAAVTGKIDVSSIEISDQEAA